MEKQEETFDISVEINPGLEPLKLSVVPYEQASVNSTQELTFKVIRDNRTLAVLLSESGHRWKLLEGDMEQEQVDSIGAAIERQYSL